MNINELYKNNPGRISECPDTGTITVNHYPEKSEVYVYTGETEDDGKGNQVPVIILQDGSDEAMKAQADAIQASMDKYAEKVDEYQQKINGLEVIQTSISSRVKPIKVG